MITRAAVLEVQDQRQIVDFYLLLKASPYFTTPLLKLGVSANGTTLLWGVLSLVGAVLVYFAITVQPLLIVASFLLFLVSEILDTSDGEIARYNRTVNPIAGKLLDGVCHKVTEFTLLGAFTLGAATLVPQAPMLVIAIALLSGEGLQAYCYERRILMMRVYMQNRGRVGGGRPTGTYPRGARWSSLPLRQKISTLSGLVIYGWIYPLTLIALLSPRAFVAALACFAAYKHASWVRLAVRTARLSPPAETAS